MRAARKQVNEGSVKRPDTVELLDVAPLAAWPSASSPLSGPAASGWVEYASLAPARG
jgi:hypothetical protein